MLAIIALGNRVYHHRDHTDFNLQRLFVFWLRALKNSQVVLQLEQFFSAAADLQKLECGNAIFYEQLLRHVFYHNSTLLERKQLIEEHFAFCQQRFPFVLLQNLSFLQQSYLSACSTRNRATSCLSYSYIPYTLFRNNGHNWRTALSLPHRLMPYRYFRKDRMP